MALGLGLLAMAVALEVLSAPWSQGVNPVHTVEGGIEEALELAGWVLVGSGVLGAVVTGIARGASDRQPGTTSSGATRPGGDSRAPASQQDDASSSVVSTR